MDQEEINLSGSFKVEPEFDFRETWDRRIQKDSFNSYNQVWSPGHGELSHYCLSGSLQWGSKDAISLLTPYYVKELTLMILG